MRRGSIITFSGLDGAGKSTQIQFLLTEFQRHERHPLHLWIRGGYTPTFHRIKELLRKYFPRLTPPPGENSRRTKSFQKKWVRRLWLTVALLDLAWICGIRIRWARLMGQVVVCDRYVEDTAIDFQLNFPEERVCQWTLWRFVHKLAPQPDIRFLLLVPVEDSLARSDRKREPYRDSRRRLEERLSYYRALAQQGGWFLLDGTLPEIELQATIQGLLATTLRFRELSHCGDVRCGSVSS